MFIVNIKDCILGRLDNTRKNERRKQDGNSNYTDKRKGAIQQSKEKCRQDGMMKETKIGHQTLKKKV